MWKIISLLLPLLLIGQDLEVRLSTRSTLPPIYLSGEGPFREILEFDLNTSGYCTVMALQNHLEEALRSGFSPQLWKKEKIPFCVVATVSQNQLEITAYNVEQGTAKKYAPTSLERHAVHRLADALQKDLFGKEGIGSLRLIYAQRIKSGDKWLSEIWVSDADGARARQATSENSYCLSPYFLPYRKDEFFYVSEKSGQSKIYRSSLSSPKSELMVELRGNQALAAISRKGTQMAFITDVAGRPDLFLQDFDERGGRIGKARQLFSAPRATQATPTFSPDGKQLAFVSDKDGPPRIYLLATSHSKGTPHPQLLTKKNRENTSPAWSPDGTKLAYSAKVDGIRQIWVYDFLTQEETALTTGPAHKENPSWAPDSFHLVYNTESEESCELYLIHLNGCEPIQITQGPGQKRFASWEFRNNTSINSNNF